jgi:hypothetical protein
VLGNWKLDENSMYRRVIIELDNLFDEFGFGNGFGEMDKIAYDTGLYRL